LGASYSGKVLHLSTTFVKHIGLIFEGLIFFEPYVLTL